MKFNIDIQYLLDTFKKLIYTPSPVGYPNKIKPVVEEIAADMKKVKVLADLHGRSTKIELESSWIQLF